MRNKKIYPTQKIFKEEMEFLWECLNSKRSDVAFTRNGEFVRLEMRAFDDVLKNGCKVYKPEIYFDKIKEAYDKMNIPVEKYWHYPMFYTIINSKYLSDSNCKAILMFYDVKDFFYTYKFSDGKVINSVLDECEIEYF